MRKRRLLTIVGIGLVASMSFVLYTVIKRHLAKADNKRRYEKALHPVPDKNNPFASDAQLTFYDSVLSNPAIDIRQYGVAQYYKGQTLLRLGKEKEAVDLLTTLVGRLSKSDPLAKDAEKCLALSYLRLGERNNCIMNHSNGSCIFPIMGKGVYTDPYASLKAIDRYVSILQTDSGDLESRWLLNLAYMTIGRYPKDVPARWLIPDLDRDESSFAIRPFQDMAGDLGLAGSRNLAGGVIVDDFDNDGYLDIVTSSWSLDESMHYYKNNGDGTFTDLTVKSGLNKIKGGLNIVQADYNNDGYPDILVLRGAWLGEYGLQPKTLLKNNGDGTFTDVTVESGILSFSPTQSGVWADFNNDGWLDLFIANETSDSAHPHPNELYLNNRDGTFTEVGKEAHCNDLAFCKGVTVADYNHDGWPDIFISTLEHHKILLKNKGLRSGIPQFENATQEAGLDKPMGFTFPTWFWDYDNDGWPDIFISGYDFTGPLANVAAAEALHRHLPANSSSMYLFRNNHDGTFTDVSKVSGLDRPVFAMGSNFGDIDNDGWPDMYLGTGNPDFRSLVPNKMFKNVDGKKFSDVTSVARVGNLQKGHGVAFADLDNDGDQDIFTVIGGSYVGDTYYNSFYVNPGQNNNSWISILLQGTKSNRSAIGAHIAVKFTEDSVQRTVYCDVNSGGSFGSNPLRKEIGLGKAKSIDELKITWPTSGILQVFKNVQVDQFIKIKEGLQDTEKMNLKRLTFKNSASPMHMNMSGMQ